MYPVVSSPLAALISVAGGLTQDVDLTQTEVTDFGPAGGSSNRQLLNLDSAGMRNLAVRPGSIVRFNPIDSDRGVGHMLVEGEVGRPGRYEIRRGERLSELIARAGGLTVQAYPFGAIFTRERVREAEQVSLRRLSRELSSAVAVAAANGRTSAEGIAAFSRLTDQLTEVPATGRVVIEADPTVLQVRPELDIVLEAGDRLFVPKRPNSVLVTGDVLNPGAMQFVTGRSIDEYVRLAGGFQRSADNNRMFVVFPNGAAQPVSVSPFNLVRCRCHLGARSWCPKMRPRLICSRLRVKSRQWSVSSH